MFHFVSSRHEAGSTIITTNGDSFRFKDMEGFPFKPVVRLVQGYHGRRGVLAGSRRAWNAPGTRRVSCRNR